MDLTNGEHLIGHWVAPIVRRLRDCVRGCICLLCISVMARKPGPESLIAYQTHDKGSRGKRTYIFPPKDGATFDTVYVSDSVITSGHGPVIWFSFYYIHAAGGRSDDKKQAPTAVLHSVK
jgi:hypothetical protein